MESGRKVSALIPSIESSDIQQTEYVISQPSHETLGVVVK
jgi:hypothetical protein